MSNIGMKYSGDRRDMVGEVKTPDGTTVVVATHVIYNHHTDESTVLFRTLKPEEQLQIYMTDDGPKFDLTVKKQGG